MAFVHAGGTILRRDLAPGQTLLVDAGCLMAFVPTVSFEIQYVGGIRTALFGGEGVFFAAIRSNEQAEPASGLVLQRLSPPRERSPGV